MRIVQKRTTKSCMITVIATAKNGKTVDSSNWITNTT